MEMAFLTHRSGCGLVPMLSELGAWVLIFFPPLGIVLASCDLQVGTAYHSSLMETYPLG